MSVGLLHGAGNGITTPAPPKKEFMNWIVLVLIVLACGMSFVAGYIVAILSALNGILKMLDEPSK